MAGTDTEAEEGRRRSLGGIEPARSRHMWTRSSVALAGDLAVVGTWDGRITAFDPALEARWEAHHPESAVVATAVDGRVVVGGRGEEGTVAAYHLASGEREWSYRTAGDVGSPAGEGVFERPYVVAVASDDRGRIYAAARRYEREGDEGRWESAVLAFDDDGGVRWGYETDASPIALAAGDGRLAVGYNRCMGSHDVGLAVLDPDSGTVRWEWDPGTEGDRRVGDVAVDGDRIAVASHGDKRGYLLGPGGEERWRVELATETEIDGERLYAYPNHAHADGGRVAFVTGNTYAVGSRETENRHPNEHRIVAFGPDGDPLWEGDVGGFVHGVATDGDRIVVPSAQNFRIRDPETHGVRRFDLADGEQGIEQTEGIATAAAVDGGTVAAIEEPVAYHDGDDVLGGYAFHRYGAGGTA